LVDVIARWISASAGVAPLNSIYREISTFDASLGRGFAKRMGGVGVAISIFKAPTDISRGDTARSFCRRFTLLRPLVSRVTKTVNTLLASLLSSQRSHDTLE